MRRRTRRQREYVERLRDPRWQRMRLSVLERAGWRCEWCGTAKVNLQIHHGYYEREALPWDYPVEALYCLCDYCHEKAERMKAQVQRELGLVEPWNQHHAAMLLRELRRVLAEERTGEENERAS